MSRLPPKDLAIHLRAMDVPPGHVVPLDRSGARHVVARTEGYGLSPIAGRADGFDRRAEGGLAIVERCSCGAQRWTLRNGPHEDQGEWC